MNKEHKRVLIVGTIPYNRQTSSRAFESYFSNWEKENLAQIFSHPKEPVHGHCNTFYQITDKDMLKRHFKKYDVGKIYYDKDLLDEWPVEKSNGKKSIIDIVYGIGSRKFPLNYLLRGMLWKKKYWCTQKLNQWIEEFHPECVFLAFSDDFFIPRIALYVAEKYDIPIVSCIGDDYYFNGRRSVSPFYYWYRSRYKKLIDRIFAHGGSAAYIGDKIKKKYNQEFHMNGKTVYLTSEIDRREFRFINTEKPFISYCGNVRLGRNESLCMIANALGKINPDYKVHVYSNETEQKFLNCLNNNKNIEFHGKVPYAKVKQIMRDSDVVLVVEGFKESDVRISRYSLSTKVADSLASGVAVLTFGSIECGAIEYMKNINCGPVCTKEEELEQAVLNLFYNKEYQKEIYDTAARISKENHSLENSNRIFESIVAEATQEYKKGDIKCPKK